MNDFNVYLYLPLLIQLLLIIIIILIPLTQCSLFQSPLCIQNSSQYMLSQKWRHFPPLSVLKTLLLWPDTNFFICAKWSFCLYYAKLYSDMTDLTLSFCKMYEGAVLKKTCSPELDDYNSFFIWFMAQSQSFPPVDVYSGLHKRTFLSLCVMLL